jgi:adenosyl cobinamide kinase/adenosyl cobinamide phosphate guanylyltransferase
MAYTLLLGGARSGKSSLAVRLADEASAPVVVLATAEARDEEMAERIAVHRAARPGSWDVVEAPLDVGEAVAGIREDACVVLDCLTLWVANALEAGWRDEEVERAAAAVATIAAGREQPTVVVTNEVGLGLVPENALGRAYRDLLGRVNAVFAAEAEQAYLMVAGRTLELT